MASSAMRGKRQPALEPVDEGLDHVRGPVAAPLILEYGDYECPYSRQAYREIKRIETELAGGVRFAFRRPGGRARAPGSSLCLEPGSQGAR
jgi:protein-disulfide isomerase